MAIVGDDSDRLPVIARQHALDRAASVRLEGDLIPDLELSSVFY